MNYDFIKSPFLFHGLNMNKLKIILLVFTLLFSKIATACELGCMLGISLGLHAMAAAIAITDKPTPENPTPKPFIVNLAPKAPASSTVPAGWAAGASQYDTPVPPLAMSKQFTCPSSTNQVNGSGTCTGNVYVSYQNNATNAASCDKVTNYSPINNSSCPTAYLSSTVNINYNSTTATSNCPSGYTGSGSSCNLTAPDSVPLPSDGQKVLERKGNELASPRDTNDEMPTGATQPTPNNVNYAYPDGGYVDVSIDPTTGKTTITNSVYDPVNNNTKTETATFGAPSSSSSTGVPLESYSAQTTNGTGSPNSTNGGTLSGSGSGATGADVAGLGNSINSKLDALNKTDYARAGEAQKAADSTNELLKASDTSQPSIDSINSSLDGIRDNLANSPSVQLPSIGFSWLPSLLPGSPVGCSPFPIDVNPTFGLAAGLVGHGEIDICDKLYFARELLAYFLSIVTLFYIFRTFTRSNKGSN